MRATETLKQEHQIVLGVVDAAEEEVARIRELGEVDTEKIAKMIGFFREFVDACHHHKEEKHLFPKLQERGMSQEVGPVAVMLHEHEEGRRLVGAVEDALGAFVEGDRGRAKDVADNLSTYMELLRAHIQKEDEVLFVMADDRLTDEDDEALQAGYDEVEMHDTGQGVHEKYHEWALEVAKH